jgi:hypothetical protein
MTTKILLSLAFIFFVFSCPAQLSLDKVYDYSLTSTKINQSEYKYYLMDVATSQCRIYNLDHTLWKTIPVSLPSGYYLYDIKFVSENLFNSDASTEFWYTAYQWISTGSSTGYYQYISKVTNETGTVLADIPGGLYANVIPAGSDTFKLAVYAYDNSGTYQTIKTYLFSLPDVTTAAEFVSQMAENPYPNPASGYINLPLNSADGGLLQVFSISGQKIFENKIQSGPLFRLNTNNWSPGMYSYRILTNGIPSDSRQFIIK